MRMPKELPILFNGEMVRAILADRKTQTRRPRIGGEPPRYQVGDRLYVRERMRVLDTRSDIYGRPGDRKCDVRYEADGFECTVPQPARLITVQPGHCAANGCWREAARIWLEVVGVRAECVSAITEADALAEGIQPQDGIVARCMTPAAAAFRSVWIDIYGAESWELGYCWVYTFRRIEVSP